MQKYKVLELYNLTTKTGKAYKRLVVEGVDGNHNVNIFSDWADFANITIGSEIEGTIEKNGQYENIRSAYQKPRSGAYSANKRDISKDVEKAQQRTTESVNKTLDRKDNSIQISSTMRDAVLTAIEDHKHRADESLYDIILENRKWLWKHWDDPQTDATYPD